MICLKIRADEREVKFKPYSDLKQEDIQCNKQECCKCTSSKNNLCNFQEEQTPLQPMEQPVRDTPIQIFRPFKSPWAVLF